MTVKNYFKNLFSKIYFLTEEDVIDFQKKINEDKQDAIQSATRGLRFQVSEMNKKIIDLQKGLSIKIDVGGNLRCCTGIFFEEKWIDYQPTGIYEIIGHVIEHDERSICYIGQYSSIEEGQKVYDYILDCIEKGIIPRVQEFSYAN